MRLIWHISCDLTWSQKIMKTNIGLCYWRWLIIVAPPSCHSHLWPACPAMIVNMDFSSDAFCGNRMMRMRLKQNIFCTEIVIGEQMLKQYYPMYDKAKLTISIHLGFQSKLWSLLFTCTHTINGGLWSQRCVSPGKDERKGGLTWRWEPVFGSQEWLACVLTQGFELSRSCLWFHGQVILANLRSSRPPCQT